MLLQANMTMASDSTQVSRVSKSLRKESNDKLKRWVQVRMIQIEQTVRLNQKCLILRWEALQADHSPSPNKVVLTLHLDSMMTALGLTQE